MSLQKLKYTYRCCCRKLFLLERKLIYLKLKTVQNSKLSVIFTTTCYFLFNKEMEIVKVKWYIFEKVKLTTMLP